MEWTTIKWGIANGNQIKNYDFTHNYTIKHEHLKESLYHQLTRNDKLLLKICFKTNCFQNLTVVL